MRVGRDTTNLSPEQIDIINDQFASPSQSPSVHRLRRCAEPVVSSGLAGRATNMSIAGVHLRHLYGDISGNNFQVFYSQSLKPGQNSAINAVAMARILVPVVIACPS